MTSSDTTAVSARPNGRTAEGTAPEELVQLALAERVHDDCDPLKLQATTWLARAQAAVSGAQAEELRPLGVSPSAFNVLLSVHSAPGQVLEPRQLAAQLMVSRPSITGLLDTLQGKGLVLRRPHAEDGRCVLVGLTPRAKRLIDDHLSVHYAVLDKAFADLDPEELAQLVGLLRRIRGAAE
jgi:DNA-binding MarR family transcriptional regulator